MKQMDYQFSLQPKKEKGGGSLFWMCSVLQFRICNPGKPRACPTGQGKENSFIERKRKLEGLE